MNEFLDDCEQLNVKYSKLFKILDKSQNVSFFTGAGISTAANIPGEKLLNHCTF